MPHPILLPAPRQLRMQPGQLILGPDAYVCIDPPAGLIAAGRTIQDAVRQHAGWHWPLVAAGGPAAKAGATISICSGTLPPQGYQFAIDPAGIRITAADPAGAFYAAQTLAQLIRQFPRALPAMEILDHPDFPVRGVMLDISRDKVPTMRTLFDLVDELAALKINQLQLYTEHTFAYRAHPIVWAEASPMSGEEILQLDQYCRERFIELVPNQNCFGHLERWLKHPQYLPLAETANGWESPWGHRDEPFSLCPTDPRSLELVSSMMDELLPHFSSRMFNVGCDETYDIGQGRSREACSRLGRERVYLDFVLKIHELAKKHGRMMQFWGDIILHKPELIGELPKEIIALEWGYEADHPFDRDGTTFKSAGVPFYVCPGTSSWLSISGRTDNAIANLKSAAENGLKHGAIGYLNTDWGDLGHLQYLPVSYLGFAAGAAYSWCWQSNRELSIIEALDAHIFRDSAGVMGKLAHDLGNVHLHLRSQRRNSTFLFWKLIGDPKRDTERFTPEECHAVEQSIESIMSKLPSARMNRPDAALIADEYRNAAAMLLHAIKRARWQNDPASISRTDLISDLRPILAAHRRLWLARNREGGLADSARRLENRLAEYQS